jgi:hypothetical protein
MTGFALITARGVPEGQMRGIVLKWLMDNKIPPCQVMPDREEECE